MPKLSFSWLGGLVSVGDAPDQRPALWRKHKSSTETIREFAEGAYAVFCLLCFIEYVSRYQRHIFSESFCYCGLRKEEEFDLLALLYPQIRLIYIDAPVIERYHRLVIQGWSSDRGMSEDTFMLEEERQVRLGLLQLRDRASFLIVNNGSIEELHACLNYMVAALRGLGYYLNKL